MTNKTLLDEFAMAAMQAVITNDSLLIHLIDTSVKNETIDHSEIAKYSYAQAQAMIEERKNYLPTKEQAGL